MFHLQAKPKQSCFDKIKNTTQLQLQNSDHLVNVHLLQFEEYIIDSGVSVTRQ